MKKILYISFAAVALLIGGCAEDFLTHESLYDQSSETFYANPAQIESALAAAYSQLVTDGGRENPTFLSNLMSDECFGSGGTEDAVFHNADGFENDAEDSQYEELWRTIYAGLLRANLIIENIDKADYINEEDKNEALGEAYFLRAFYHFRATQFFGDVTMRTSAAPGPDVNTPSDVMYGQIASDLKMAISLMKATHLDNMDASRHGHATKWAAQGIMARVFLFYTGLYNQTEIALPEGGAVTKADVITWLEEVIDDSGHGLLSDFRSLWPYSYLGEDTAGDKIYPYAAENNLTWARDGHKETIFSVKFSVFGSHVVEGPDPNNPYSRILSYSNQLSLYMGVRAANANTYFPFSTGWGGGQVSPVIWNNWPDTDLRKQGSILNVNDKSLNEGEVLDNFAYNVWGSKDETGIYNKKYTKVAVNDGNGGVTEIYRYTTGLQDDYQLNNMQDEVLLRFADVLLMHSELTETVTGINAVRTRAQQDPIGAYSLAALQNERHWELAFEGLRYWDILRWGIAEENIEAANGTKTLTEGVEDTYSVDFQDGRKFLPIPESQIRLSEDGSFKQNGSW